MRGRGSGVRDGGREIARLLLKEVCRVYFAYAPAFGFWRSAGAGAVGPHAAFATRLPGPKAAEWLARDGRVLSPSYTRMYPLVVARGFGSTIEDVDGNRFLDFTAGIAVAATGHCHPEVVAAIADQAQRLIHMSGTDFYYQPEIELAERLARLAPGATRKRVFFTNSGTESIEAALKLARYHTGRSRAISFYGAFHGRTYGAMSLERLEGDSPRRFRPAGAGSASSAVQLFAARHRRVVRLGSAAEEVAAIFVEPIQGESGYRVAAPGFLRMLREVCDHYGILLVMDEIQSGLGRTGKMFACQHFGPTAMPDLLCIAKGIASGMPLGALIALRRPDGLAAGKPCLDVRRQSRMLPGGASDVGSDRAGISGERGVAGVGGVRRAGAIGGRSAMDSQSARLRPDAGFRRRRAAIYPIRFAGIDSCSRRSIAACSCCLAARVAFASVPRCASRRRK